MNYYLCGGGMCNRKFCSGNKDRQCKKCPDDRLVGQEQCSFCIKSMPLSLWSSTAISERRT